MLYFYNPISCQTVHCSQKNKKKSLKTIKKRRKVGISLEGYFACGKG